MTRPCTLESYTFVSAEWVVGATMEMEREWIKRLQCHLDFHANSPCEPRPIA